jgi:hypothetical protein
MPNWGPVNGEQINEVEPPPAPQQPAVTGLVRNRRRRLGGQR